MLRSKKVLVASVLAGIMSLQLAAVSQAASADKAKATPKFKAPKLALKVDRYDVAQLPMNYRRGDDAFQKNAVNKMKDAKLPSRKGMEKANYSASSCMSEKEFQAVLKNAGVDPSKVWDIDLRAESHGYFDGMAVSWYAKDDWGNDGREQFIIESIEKDQLAKAFKKQPIKVHAFDDANKDSKVQPPFDVTATKVRTEGQMVKDNGANYFRLALQDHFRPDDKDVDRFLVFWKQLPKDAWLHYHCAAGVGRTAVFSTMHDILKSAGNGVSFDDLIKRQYLIGPTNLATWEGKANWKKKSYKERYIFLRQFYDYVQNHPKLDIPYSQWTKEHGYDSLDDNYEGYIWRMDTPDRNQLPRNFRTAQSPLEEIVPKAMASEGVKDWLKDGHKISEKGLRQLHMSGSAFFSYQEGAQLKAALRKLTDGPIYIMDLREETHGYINGNGVSWYGWRDWGNYGRTYKQVRKIENETFAALKPGTKIILSELVKDKSPKNPQLVTVKEAMTEENFVKNRLGLNYFRITATDHIFPTSENVDKFINFYKKLPKNAWLHYHCQAGAGRTTAYMVMQDMMENANAVPMFDILLRQQMIGGNFTAYTQKKMKKGEWKMDYYNHKAKYIKKFYKYCQQQAPKGFAMSWTDWLAKNDVL